MTERVNCPNCGMPVELEGASGKCLSGQCQRCRGQVTAYWQGASATLRRAVEFTPARAVRRLRRPPRRTP
jgi:uncharacterized paraquat-inducible protein A